MLYWSQAAAATPRATAVTGEHGTLTFAELAAAIPRAGGMYVWLSEAYGDLIGFLQGWAYFVVANVSRRDVMPGAPAVRRTCERSAPARAARLGITD